MSCVSLRKRLKIRFSAGWTVVGPYGSRLLLRYRRCGVLPGERRRFFARVFARKFLTSGVIWGLVRWAFAPV